MVAAFQRVGAVVEGSGSTDGRWGSRSRALLGRREAGDGGSTVMWCSAAAMAGAAGVWRSWARARRSGSRRGRVVEQGC